jgi:GNAT superfamily N-acetyltransferase
MKQPRFDPAHLAPGDSRTSDADWSALEVHRISSVQDPNFETAYRFLWDEFGSLNELETRSVLASRFGWDLRTPQSGYHCLYEMLLITAHGGFAAARDHAVIIPECGGGCLIHLSHVLVHPLWRRTGLAGWTRSLPLQAAGHALEVLGHPAETPISLVAEMEYPDESNDQRFIRLAAYEKAGFKKVDPTLVHYLQPDFRPPSEIDSTGGPRPLPLTMVIRRVGREGETHITGAELAATVRALYSMYGRDFRAKDLDPVLASLRAYPAANAHIPLVAPTL